MVDLTDGQKLLQEYQDAGYSDTDIATMRQTKTREALDAGYSQKEVDDFWGDNQPKSPTLGNVLKENLAQQKFDPSTLDTADPNSWMEMFQTGFDWSSGSLMAGRTPGKIMPEESGIMAKIMAGAGQIVGDAPAMIAGAIGGAALVAPETAAIGAKASKTPVGALAGGSFGIGAGAGFGGAALPTVIREVILDDMINGKFSSWDDVMERSWHIMKETAVEGTIGALTGVAGRKAFLVTRNTARPIMRTTEVATMAATGATTSGLFHGRVPTAEDFILGVALTGVIPVGGKFAGDLYRLVGARQRAELTDTGEAIAARMQQMWAKTGIDPKEQGRAAGSDPIKRQAVMGADADGQVVTDAFADMAPVEQPKKSATVEIDGGMQKPTFGKKAEGEAPVEFKQLERTGEVSEVTGVAPVKNINVEQFAQIVNEATPDIVDALYPDRTVREQQMGERLTEIVGKYKNADGSFDLEAGLIEFYESGDKAMLFRANGRKYGALHPNTQRALEKAGFLLDRDGYKPMVPAAGAGGGGSMKPPPPKGPGSEVGLPGSPKGGKEGHFARDKEFVNEDINEVYGESIDGQTWPDYYRQNKGDWRELAIMAELDKRFKVTKSESDIGLEDMFRLTLSSAGRAKVRKEVGGYRITVDKSGNPMYELNDAVPALNKVWKGAEKGPLKVEGGVPQLRNYLQALDTLDRVKLGLETSVKPELAQELLTALPKAELKKLEALADMHRKVFNDTLEGAVQHHILSRKAADTIMERHPNWFPQIVAEGESGYLTGAIRGVKSAIKRAKGHGYAIKDPILETLHAMDQRERLGSANLARRALVQVLREQGLIEGDPKVNRLKLEGPIKGDVLDEHGNIIKGVEKKFFEHNPNEVVYYESGMRREVRIKDFPGRQEIMRLLEGPSVFDKNLGISLLTTAAKIKRMAIVELPDFLLRAMFMDSFNVAIMSKDGGLPIKNTIRGALDAIDYATSGKTGGGEGYKKRIEYLLNGGYDMTLADMDADHTLQSYHVMTSPGHVARVINSIKHPLEGVQTIFRMTDSFTRMGGVYTNARGRIGPIRAAMDSRRASLDFGERSLSPVVNLLASLTPFFAPTMRGLDSFQHLVKKDPLGILMRGSVLTTAAVTLTALNYAFDEMMGEDIPESAKYGNINRREKDTFMHIPFVNPIDGQVTRLRLPLPFGLGPIFAGWVPRMFDKMKTDDPRAFKGYRDSIVAKFFGGLVPLAGNPLIQPWMEALANYDFHSGKPWIPQRMENLSGPNQYYPWTSEVSKNIAAMVSQAGYDLSPLTFDKFLNAWTGQLGPNILRITDKAMKDNPMPRDIANTPFMGSFFLRNPGVSAQPINDFYDEYEAYKKAAGDVTFLESGDKEDTPEYEKAVAALEKFDGTDMALVAQALTEQRKVMYEMYEDDTLDANDKRQILDEVAGQMIETTRIALQELDEARKDAEEDGP